MAFTSIVPVCRDVNATIAAGTPETWEMLRAPSWIKQGQLIEASWTNGGALTGNGTNYTTVDIFNVTTSVALASRALSTPTTDDVVADTPQVITMSATIAYQKFLANAQIRARKTDSGTGMAITVPARFQGNFILNGTWQS